MPAGAARIFTSEPSSGCSLSLGRSIIEQEARALRQLAARLDDQFSAAVDHLAHCHGSLIVTGMGKAGWIGQKLAATFASTGSPSHFLHPAEAVHGDLGRVGDGDTILVLSYSGETAEVTRLLPSLARYPMVAITSRATSTLGKAADCVLTLGDLREADPLKLAPSTSTTAMLAVGDALALAMARKRHFQASDFARFHPGGSLGRKLAKVEDVMRPLSQCRVALERQTVREVLVHVGQPGRRTGATMLVNEQGRLTGIFTDSDLARLFETHREAALDDPIATVMCPRPLTVEVGTRLPAAIDRLASCKISELPVVDNCGCPVGLIDITDIVAEQPSGWLTSHPCGLFPLREPPSHEKNR